MHTLARTVALIAIQHLVCASPASADTPTYANSGERWGVQEVAVRSPREYGNPFTEATFTCEFRSNGRTVSAAGFYDLDGDGPPRYGFLPKVMQGALFTQMEPPDSVHGPGAQLLGKRGAYYLLQLARVPRRTAANSAAARPPAAEGAPLGGTSGSSNVQIELESGLYRVDMIDCWNMRIYALGYTRGGDSQSFRPKISPGLMRFVKVENPEGGLLTGSVTQLFASFAAAR